MTALTDNAKRLIDNRGADLEVTINADSITISYDGDEIRDEVRVTISADDVNAEAERLVAYYGDIETTLQHASIIDAIASDQS